jgi:predicted nucleotidyltransferase
MDLTMPATAVNVHAITLADSAALSRHYMPRSILPTDVIEILNRAKISYVLVGAHGVFGWMKVEEARITKDVDILVTAKHQKKALKALLKEFPYLESIDSPVVTRLKDPKTGQIVIDLMKPNELYRAAFKHTHTVLSGKKLKYRVPSLEMALAMKFAAMVSPNREDVKKIVDSHDFIVMVRANPELDLEKLKMFGALVYPEGGQEILELIRRVRAGETLIL